MTKNEISSTENCMNQQIGMLDKLDKLCEAGRQQEVQDIDINRLEDYCATMREACDIALALAKVVKPAEATAKKPAPKKTTPKKAAPAPKPVVADDDDDFLD